MKRYSILHNILMIFISLAGLSEHVQSQHISHPYIHSKSHPTLTLDSIVIGSGKTVFYLRIENRIEGGGWFCASKHIEIEEDSTGMKWLVTGSQGIPTCPDAHKFNHQGEQLSFVLFAPKLSPFPTSISIRERCATGCIRLEGIVMDSVLSSELVKFDRAVLAYRAGKKEAAQHQFEHLYRTSHFRQSKHFGYVLYILPRIAYERKHRDEAKRYYHALVSSHHPDADHFISQLNKIEFFRTLD